MKEKNKPAERDREATEKRLVDTIGQRSNGRKTGFQIVETVSRLTGYPQAEIVAMASIITAFITYLIMFGEFCPAFNGIAINEDSGWEQISAGIDVLVDKVLKI